MRKTLIIGIIGLLLCGSSSAFALPLRNSLAMFESGATAPFAGASDRMRGASGEVSRYQIMPDVWRRYSSSRDYTNPEVAWSVAKVILNERIAQFKEATGRQPSAEEVYLLWNKPGHFESAGYNVQKVRTLYRNRAQRFANLHAALDHKARPGQT